jgi:hypothetical protein
MGSIIHYFSGCCGGVEPFGITSGTTDDWSSWFSYPEGKTYPLSIETFKGCVTYSGSSLSSVGNYQIYNTTPIGLQWESDCEKCFNTYPCYTPPIITPPTIIGYKNECGIITILPMVVDCVVSNPTSYDSYDGQVSLLISGGTPPYETTWWNTGNVSPAIDGLGNGYYTATTVDYWHDYTAITVCNIHTERDCSFSGTISNYTPTPIDNTHYYYTISLTMESTSDGPYTIYYNSAPPGPADIPILYPSGVLAQNIPRTTLQLGIIVKVPNTTPVNLGVFYIYNEHCLNNTVTLIVPTVSLYPDFCLSVSAPKKGGISVSDTHFIYNGLDSNNKPTWIDENELNPNSTINWDGTRWLLSSTIYGNIMFSNTQLTSSITYPTNWFGTGGFPLQSITTNEGSCGNVRKQLPPVSVNQPTCLCDGSIIFNVTLDNPPFNYSIDNGVTYSSSPIFTNLCSGIYSLLVVDSLLESYSSSVTLDKQQQSTTYSISLKTINTTPVNNNISLVNTYETIVDVNPSLPDGTTITFDIIHNNSFYSSPTSGTSILTTGTVLTKNITPISINSTVTGNTQSINTITNCQKEYVYQSNIDDVWSSLTISNNDTITINTTSRVDKTTLGECVVGYCTDNYSISNPVISGCDCCSIKIN